MKPALALAAAGMLATASALAVITTPANAAPGTAPGRGPVSGRCPSGLLLPLR